MYRVSNPPETPRVRYQWVVRRIGDDVAVGSATALTLIAACVALCFIVSGAAPYVLRAIVVWVLFAAVWCAVFVRREPVP
jgi:predicted membrane metal-binding protein